MFRAICEAQGRPELFLIHTSFRLCFFVNVSNRVGGLCKLFSEQQHCISIETNRREKFVYTWSETGKVSGNGDSI